MKELSELQEHIRTSMIDFHRNRINWAWRWMVNSYSPSIIWLATIYQITWNIT